MQKPENVVSNLLLMSSLTEKANDLVLREALWFMERLIEAQAQNKPVTLRLKEVEDNPLLLYACLWIANRKNVAVLFEPNSSTTGENAEGLKQT